MKLSALQTKVNGYSLLDFSPVYGLAELFDLNLTKEEDIQDLSWIISYTSAIVSAEVGGIILGPEIGYEAILQKSPHTGLALTLEKQSELLAVNELPRLYDRWGVEHIRNNYGVVYLKLYYHPSEELASQKIQLAGEIYDAAQYENVDLVIELALYPVDKRGQFESFEQTQLFAVKQFQSVCDMLVLEYPHSAFSCATLSAELDVPWILADRTEDYAQYKENLRTALENGAQGCQISAVAWSGLPVLKLSGGRQQKSENWRSLEKYIQTEFRDRLIEINRIIGENKLKDS